MQVNKAFKKFPVVDVKLVAKNSPHPLGALKQKTHERMYLKDQRELIQSKRRKRTFPKSLKGLPHLCE